MTWSFGSLSGRQPKADTCPAKVIFTSVGASLRRNATDMSVSANRRSFGLRRARQTSCCPFCAVSFRAPVTGVTSNTTDCSIDTAFGGAWPGAGCACAGLARNAARAMRAIRGVRSVDISAPAAPRFLEASSPAGPIGGSILFVTASLNEDDRVRGQERVHPLTTRYAGHDGAASPPYGTGFR